MEKNKTPLWLTKMVQNVLACSEEEEEKDCSGCDPNTHGINSRSSSGKLFSYLLSDLNRLDRREEQTLKSCKMQKESMVRTHQDCFGDTRQDDFGINPLQVFRTQNLKAKN